MINDHELSLIAQLADGTADSDDAAAARALIESNPEAQAEYDAQVLALSALREAGPALLSPAERADLHAALVDQLGLTPEPAPVAARRRWTVPWGGLAVAAAALVGVVLLAPLLALLSTGDDGDAADTANVAAEAPADTTAALDRSSLSLSDAADPLGSPAPPATEEAGAAITSAPGSAFGQGPAEYFGSLPYLGALGAEELARLEADLAAVPDETEALQFSLSSRDGAQPADGQMLQRLAEQAACAAGIPEGFDADALAFADVSGALVVLYRLESAAGAEGPFLLVLDLATCSELTGVDSG